jgi:hypothetical protein
MQKIYNNKFSNKLNYIKSIIKSENEVAVKLRKQLEHEMVVLEERKAVSCSEDFFI